ncbi:hypothetical protein HWV62_12356 [Athelia sp. TMB]|nr:hypothetical protein HWV62_12356 [Athelia sp. TMB]
MVTCSRYGYSHPSINAMASGIQTRKSNKDAHPGLPDYDSDTAALPIPAARKPRRTPLELREERNAKAAAKQLKAEERQKAIKKVAAIENALAAADEENRQSAARPAAKATVKAARPKSKAAALSSDKIDTHGPKSKPAAVRPGRSDVNQQREVMREESAQKRKASIGDTEPVKKAKTSAPDSTGDSDIIPAVGRHSRSSSLATSVPSSRATSVASRHSERRASSVSSRHSEPADVEFSDADDLYANNGAADDDQRDHYAEPKKTGMDYGGLEDEDESVEHEYAVEEANKSSGVKLETMKNFVSIIPNAPTNRLGASKPIIIATSASAVSSRPSRAVGDILPPGTQTAFARNMVPRLRDFAGTLDIAWDNGLDQDVLASLQCFWDEEFPDHPQTLVMGDPITKLCYQRIYEWRGHFGTVALTAVQNLFATTITLANGKTKKVYDSVASRQDYVSRALGEGVPFLYSEVEYDHNDEPAFKGLFLSDLILTVLYSHFKDTGTVSPELASPEPPKAAIALAAAAVERALKCWSSGAFVKPKDSKFSEAQWGSTTDEFMTSVQLLSEKKFSRIISGAMEYAPKKPVAASTGRMSRVSRVIMQISDDESECDTEPFVVGWRKHDLG